jgi:hypothetical protein
MIGKPISHYRIFKKLDKANEIAAATCFVATVNLPVPL